MHQFSQEAVTRLVINLKMTWLHRGGLALFAALFFP